MRRPFVCSLLAAALPLAGCSQEAPEREPVEAQPSPAAQDDGTPAAEPAWRDDTRVCPPAEAAHARAYRTLF